MVENYEELDFSKFQRKKPATPTTLATPSYGDYRERLTKVGEWMGLAWWYVHYALGGKTIAVNRYGATERQYRRIVLHIEKASKAVQAPLHFLLYNFYTGMEDEFLLVDGTWTLVSQHRKAGRPRKMGRESDETRKRREEREAAKPGSTVKMARNNTPFYTYVSTGTISAKLGRYYSR